MMGRHNWTTVGLSRGQVCFLDRISKKAKFSGGRKLSRTAILRAIIKTARKLGIDAAGVKTERELKGRILEAFKRGK
ncbi:MAG: hypothetical protein PHC71_06125 [Candidatus Omnitrophica bacterium]|nr:hypothetical protein [Candidatus Omnitrophota bacterium]